MKSEEKSVSNGHAGLGLTGDDIMRLRRMASTESGDSHSIRSSVPKMPSSPSLRGQGRRLSNFEVEKYQQKFTDQQKVQLQKYSSVNYQPSHSELYMNWLRSLPHVSFEVDRWFLLILSGVCIGLLAVLLKQCLQFLDNLKWNAAKKYSQDSGTLIETWLCVWAIATVYVLLSSLLVVFVHPPAAGSGVPEVISYLNGILVHGIFSVRNLMVKFVSLVFAVSSGLPTATQGPIIALGAIIGRGIGQFQSHAFGFNPGWFKRFHNAEDRRAFTTAGVAAGVSAAFNAPIGGLLFAMEDLTSFWSKRLCWQTFFCSSVAAAIASVFDQAFYGFTYQGNFGLFRLSIKEPIQIHVLSLIPAIILGVIGGLLGALFTRLNNFLVALRKRLLGKIANIQLQRVAQCVETAVLVMIMVTFAVYLPLVFGCTKGELHPNITDGLEHCGWSVGASREVYNCPPVNETDDFIYYNEVATLVQGSGTSFLQKLVTRGTYRWYSYGPLAAILVVWYFMTIYTCGTAIAGGIFLPNLISGALYGRILGVAMIDVYDALHEDSGWDVPLGDPTWGWLDPGVMAVIGAGSLLGGVTRLTLAVTVIVIEMSNDLDLTVPVLIAIWVAKLVADMLSKPLYKYQLDSKALPYLENDPLVAVDGRIANLELYKARNVMSSPVLSIKLTDSVRKLAHNLLSTTHNSFPVVRYDKETRTELAVGLITRLELYIILCHEDVYSEEGIGAVVTPEVQFREISLDHISNESATMERIRMYAKFQIYQNIYINLDSFINQSVPKIDQEYSLKRTYQQFQMLGHRNMLVTDKKNHVTGVITRKDLMPYNLEQKLLQAIQEEEVDESETPSECSDDYWSVRGSCAMLRNKLTQECIIEEEEVSETGSDTGDCGKIENEAEAGGDCGTVVFTIGGRDILTKDTVLNMDNTHIDDTAL